MKPWIALATSVMFLAACRPPQAANVSDSMAMLERGVPGVTVSDSLIRIPLKNGEVVELITDKNDEGELVDYTYDRHLRGAPFHAVKVSYYEAIDYLLIHDSTGRRIVLDDDPKESPLGSYLLIASRGVAADTTEDALTIVRISGDSVVTEWNTDTEKWDAKDPVWNGEDTIYITRIRPGTAQRGGSEAPAMLVRVGDHWVLRDAKPRSAPPLP
jgi:hypothetical protein